MEFGVVGNYFFVVKGFEIDFFNFDFFNVCIFYFGRVVRIWFDDFVFNNVCFKFGLVDVFLDFIEDLGLRCIFFLILI